MAEPDLPQDFDYAEESADNTLFLSDDDKKKKAKKKKPTVKKGKAASKLDKPKNAPINRGPRTKNVSNVETTEPPTINRGPRSNSSDNKVSSTKFLAGMKNAPVGEGGSPKLNFSAPLKSIKPLATPESFMSKNVLAKKDALTKAMDEGNEVKDKAAEAGWKVTEVMRDRFNKAKESYNRNKLTRDEKVFDEQERRKKERVPTFFDYTPEELSTIKEKATAIKAGERNAKKLTLSEKLIKQREDRLQKIREYKEDVRKRKVRSRDPMEKDSEGKTRQQRYDDQFGGQPFGKGTILSQYSGKSNLDRRMEERIKRNELDKKARDKEIAKIKK